MSTRKRDPPHPPPRVQYMYMTSKPKPREVIYKEISSKIFNTLYFQTPEREDSFQNAALRHFLFKETQFSNSLRSIQFVYGKFNGQTMAMLIKSLGFLKKLQSVEFLNRTSQLQIQDFSTSAFATLSTKLLEGNLPKLRKLYIYASGPGVEKENEARVYFVLGRLLQKKSLRELKCKFDSTSRNIRYFAYQRLRQTHRMKFLDARPYSYADSDSTSTKDFYVFLFKRFKGFFN